MCNPINKENLLLERLIRYSNRGYYPFHMPGHKRQNNLGFLKEFPNPYAIDITEIHGFDNLHNPKGILKESMEWAAQVYGADKTYYLVNGSSCGILSAISAVTHFGGKLLIGRNCHKSAYHGAILKQCKTVYVYPPFVGHWGINGGILAEDVKRLLEENPDTEAVIIVSPTYEGVVSDIEKIAQVIHKKNIPLIVDEAHGAHFPFSGIFPKPALECGADIVVQSLHKTAPSLTQTALLHVKGELVDLEKLERYLQMYQSSSPSYVFMASIERCIYEMWEKGEEYFKTYASWLNVCRKKLACMKHLKLLDDSLHGQWGIHGLDPSKIVVSCGDSSLKGTDLDQMLREKYHLEMEMCGVDYVTAITTLFDTKEGLQRLVEAFYGIDRTIMAGNRETVVWEHKAWVKTTLAHAIDAPYERIPIADCEERVSAEFIYLYPPGIPIIAPGELITRQIIGQVIQYRQMGLPVQGMADKEAEYLRVFTDTGANHG